MKKQSEFLDHAAFLHYSYIYDILIVQSTNFSQKGFLEMPYSESDVRFVYCWR